MGWILAALAVAVLGVGAVVASGQFGEQPTHVDRDIYAPTLGSAMLTPDDIAQARLGITLRGYSIAQVDELLARLASEIALRDQMLAEAGLPVTPKEHPPARILAENAE